MFGDMPNTSTASLTICTNTETPIFTESSGGVFCLSLHGDPASYHSYHYNFPLKDFPVVILRNKPAHNNQATEREGFLRKNHQLTGQFAIHRTGKKQGLGDIVVPVVINTGSSRPCIFVACHNVSTAYRS